MKIYVNIMNNLKALFGLTLFSLATGSIITNKIAAEITGSSGSINKTGVVISSNTGSIIPNKTGSIVTSEVAGGPTWGYGVSGTGVYGPDDWGKMYEKCKGSNQSPIVIFPQATPYKIASKPMAMESDNALGLVTGVLTNNGHTVQFTVNAKGGMVFLAGGPADSANYILSTIQFHVGCTDGSGSEHTLNAIPASAEMQMIFYNKKYKNINNAVIKPDGVTIIAVLFDYYGGYTLYENPTLERLVSFLPNITKPGSSVTLDYDERIELTKLVPDLTQDYPYYYTYRGSLTTPPCYESVTWILLKTHLSISIQQLGQFRQLQGNDGSQLCDNFRPTQPSNNREVTKNFLN
ncbi:carbonic anhydrase 2-like [Actinia tenebrosa]|uniref:Carbonic anhydrase 2-like n=1 Tax=Actinia tenebrosa TaxID=6105 RepID=A0A6P8IYA8_ACTTE|nr:carbonic anhydrase 2-like [Actinia tenebrosa]